MREKYLGWQGPWLKYNGVEVPLKMEGIRDGPDGYVEIDVPTATIIAHNFNDGSRVIPRVHVVKDITGRISDDCAGVTTYNQGLLIGCMVEMAILNSKEIPIDNLINPIQIAIKSYNFAKNNLTETVNYYIHYSPEVAIVRLAR